MQNASPGHTRLYDGDLRHLQLRILLLGRPRVLEVLDMCVLCRWWMALVTDRFGDNESVFVTRFGCTLLFGGGS